MFGSEPPVFQIDVSGDDLSYETSKPAREKNGEEEEEENTGHSNKSPSQGATVFLFLIKDSLAFYFDYFRVLEEDW